MRTVGISLALLCAAATTHAQGFFGRGSGAAETSVAASMETNKGKIILLNGNTLFKIDKKSMKIEAKRSLSKLIELYRLYPPPFSREGSFPRGLRPLIRRLPQCISVRKLTSLHL